jgi:hypothetical protein
MPLTEADSDKAYASACDAIENRVKGGISPKCVTYFSAYTLDADQVPVDNLDEVPVTGKLLVRGSRVRGGHSFVLLFLIQRSQSKDTLSLQVKLNELLAAAHRASPELINVEDRSESEVREIHDRFQEIQQRGPGAHSIADLDSQECAGPIP